MEKTTCPENENKKDAVQSVILLVTGFHHHDKAVWNIGHRNNSVTIDGCRRRLLKGSGLEVGKMIISEPVGIMAC